jgi:CTP:molybdopterin cytidylyltransferase MocA
MLTSPLLAYRIDASTRFGSYADNEAVIAAVILAAGAATRFGSPKQAILLPQVIERVRASSVDAIVVVAGAHRIDDLGVGLVECSEWERGPGASLRCGLEALGAEVEAAVVCLADGPDLASAAIDRVVAAWRRGARDVVAASYGGVRGHPVVIGRPVWAGIPDEGARTLEAALVPCDDLGEPGDVDTPADLERLGQSARVGGGSTQRPLVDGP